MPRTLLILIVSSLNLVSVSAVAAEAAKPAAPAQKPGAGARTSDPLANLKPHEERRYRIDMQDCGKENGVERRLCERSVRSKAAAKSRRRGAAGR